MNTFFHVHIIFLSPSPPLPLLPFPPSLVVAIELIAACQSLDFHRPKRTTDPLEEVYKLVRSVVKTMDTDRFMAPDIAAVTNLIQEGKVRGRGGERERAEEKREMVINNNNNYYYYYYY